MEDAGWINESLWLVRVMPVLSFMSAGRGFAGSVEFFELHKFGSTSVRSSSVWYLMAVDGV